MSLIESQAASIDFSTSLRDFSHHQVLVSFGASGLKFRMSGFQNALAFGYLNEIVCPDNLLKLL